MKLTNAQTDVLQAMRELAKTTGEAPTFRAIAKRSGYGRNTVSRHVYTLMALDLVTRQPGGRRSGRFFPAPEVSHGR